MSKRVTVKNSMINDTTPTDIALWRTNNQPLLDGGEGKSPVSKNNICVARCTTTAGAQLHTSHWGLGTSALAVASLPTTDGTHPIQTDLPVDVGMKTEHASSSLSTPAAGLLAPAIDDTCVTGAHTDMLRKLNKRTRIRKQRLQTDEPIWWTTHKGDFVLPDALPLPESHKNQMCPPDLPCITLLQKHYFNMPKEDAQRIQVAIGLKPKYRRQSIDGHMPRPLSQKQ